MSIKSWLKVLERLDKKIGEINTRKRHKSFHHFTYLKKAETKMLPEAKIYSATVDG